MQVLVVQEKNGAFKGQGVWKFPTGANEVSTPQLQFFIKFFRKIQEMISPWIETFYPQGEDICTAAIREVKEETGVSNLWTQMSMIFTYVQFYTSKYKSKTIAFIFFQIEAEFVEVLAFR